MYWVNVIVRSGCLRSSSTTRGRNCTLRNAASTVDARMPRAMASCRTPARNAEKSPSAARASPEIALGAAQNGTANMIRRLTRSTIEQPLSNPLALLARPRRAAQQSGADAAVSAPARSLHPASARGSAPNRANAPASNLAICACSRFVRSLFSRRDPFGRRTIWQRS